MFHYHYIGHFEHEGDFIRFQRSDDRPYRPVVKQPIEWGIVEELFRLKNVAATDIPEEWGLGADDSGYFVWDSFCKNQDAREFVQHLAARTGCDLADYSSLTLMRPHEL
jgi:hypothetical protein